MNDFQVGDEVKIVGNGNPTKHLLNIGNEGKIVGWCSGEPLVNPNNDSLFNQIVSRQNLEPVKEGSNMKDVSELEAIAVVGDDDLKQKLIELAEENEFSKAVFYNLNTSVIFYKNHPDSKSFVINNDSRDYKEEPNGSFGRVSSCNRMALQLPQDWDRAKAFVTQDFDGIEPFEINCHEVEVEVNEENWKLSKVEIGCWDGTVNDILSLRDELKNVGTASGNLDIAEETVGIIKFYNFADWLEENYGEDK